MNEIPNDKFELISCPVCRSDRLNLRLKIRFGDLKQKKSLDYSALGIGEGTWFFVKECAGCGFVFVNPRVKAAHEGLVYNESKEKMYRAEDTGSPVSPRRNALHAISLLESALNSNFGESADPVLFDYGCGFGHSMSLARELGFTVYGVDIDRRRLSSCESRGLQVAAPAEFDGKFPGVKADVIVCQSILEHITDLPAAMGYLAGKSKKGTILFMDGFTPEIISIEKKRGEFVKAHFVEHINFFPLKTLDRFAGNFGFRPMDRRARIYLVGGQVQALKSFGFYFAEKYLPVPVAGWLFEMFGGGVFNRFYRYDG